MPSPVVLRAHGGGGGDGAPAQPEKSKKDLESREVSAPKVAWPIQQLIDKKSTANKSTELQIVKGRVSIKLKLDSLTPDTISQLQKAGLKIVKKDGQSMTIVGSISIDKLANLLKVRHVLEIEPTRI